VLNDCPLQPGRLLIFNAPMRGPSGEFEVTLCILAVCEAHESVVEDFGMRHAVSEGFWVSIDRQGDVERVLRINARINPGMASNVHGPLVLA
jgi:hypothetical protein